MVLLQPGELYSLPLNSSKPSPAWESMTESACSEVNIRSLLVKCALWLALPIFLTYFVSNLALILDTRLWKGIRKPPVMPYWVPGIGHTLTFVFDRVELVKTIRCALLKQIYKF